MVYKENITKRDRRKMWSYILGELPPASSAGIAVHEGISIGRIWIIPVKLR